MSEQQAPELSPEQMQAAHEAKILDDRVAEIEAAGYPLLTPINEVIDTFNEVGEQAAGYVTATNRLKVYLPEIYTPLMDANPDADMAAPEFILGASRRMLAVLADLNTRLAAAMYEDSIRSFATTKDAGHQANTMEESLVAITANAQVIRKVTTAALSAQGELRAAQEAAQGEAEEAMEEERISEAPEAE